MRLIIRFNWLDFARFVLISAIGTVGFNNLGFLNALAIFEGVIVATLMFTRLGKAGRTIAISTGLLIMQMIVSLYVLMPFISSQLTYAATITNTKTFGGNLQSEIESTSPPLYQVIRFEFDKYKFPSLNLLRPISLTNVLAKLIFLVPALLIVYMVIAIRRKSVVEKKIYVSFFILWIFTIVLCARVSPPFGYIMTILFKTPLLLLLRSPDKAIIFYPFFVFVPLYLGLQIWDLKGKVASLVAAILLLLPLPYYFGGITTYVSQGYAANLLTSSDSGYKVAVTTPDPYKEAAARLNSTSGGGSIISVPFSSINSLNWANYPAWNYVGADYLYQLFKRPYISADVFDHPALETTMSFENFDTKNQSPTDFLNLVKKFYGQYVLYHKDIHPSLAALAGPTRHAINVLENEGILTLMMSNRYFDLYQVRNDEVVPLISSPWSGQYQEVSPVEYRLTLSNIGEPGNITFRQSENPSWGLYLNVFNKTDCKSVYTYPEPFGFSPVMNLAGPFALTSVMNECSPGKKLDFVGGLEYLSAPDSVSSSHRLVDDYANRWTIDPAYITSHFPRSYYHEDANGNIDISLTMYFKPQAYFYLGLVVLGVVSLGSICLLVYELRSRKMRAGRELRGNVDR